MAGESDFTVEKCPAKGKKNQVEFMRDLAFLKRKKGKLKRDKSKSKQLNDD